MTRHELRLAFMILSVNSINFILAKCPPPSMSVCNCTETKIQTRLMVSCDGLASVPDLKYQLEGIPSEEILELAILRTKNFNGLRPDFFDNFKILRRLSLAANPLSNLKLPVGLFSKIGATLEALDLSTSNQTEKDLPPALFEPLVNLKHLDLSNNQIAQIRPQVLAPLTKLKVLDLGDNKLTSLPASPFAALTSMEMLDLNDNMLIDLPLDLFADVQKSMRILDIGGNKIQSLTADQLVLMPNLEVLDARKNQINPLNSDVFSKSPKLARISLDGLLAAVIPPHVFDKIPLESIDLSDCINVRALPENLFSAVGQTLKEMHLDDNPKILSLPKNFFHGLEKLEILDIANMGIELLPNSFWSDLPALKKLKISDNPWLKSLPKPTSYSLDLKNVDAGNCKLMPPKVLSWMKANFDTRSLMLDFPINIYRSINHEIQMFHVTMQPADGTTRMVTARRPMQGAGGGAGGDFGNNGGRGNGESNSNNGGSNNGGGGHHHNNGGGRGNGNNNNNGGNNQPGNNDGWDASPDKNDNNNNNNNNGNNNYNNGNNGGGGGWGWGYGR